MYQVGKLIDGLSFRSLPLLELRDNLLHPITEQRFTAEQTLKFLFDSCGQA
jgi:hypothetical protein